MNDQELKSYAEACAIDMTNLTLPERIKAAERHLKQYADAQKEQWQLEILKSLKTERVQVTNVDNDSASIVCDVVFHSTIYNKIEDLKAQLLKSNRGEK